MNIKSIGLGMSLATLIIGAVFGYGKLANQVTVNSADICKSKACYTSIAYTQSVIGSDTKVIKNDIVWIKKALGYNHNVAKIFDTIDEVK